MVPEQIVCGEPIVLEVITGFTEIWITPEVSKQLTEVTILLYHVVTVIAPGE